MCNTKYHTENQECRKVNGFGTYIVGFDSRYLLNEETAYLQEIPYLRGFSRFHR